MFLTFWRSDEIGARARFPPSHGPGECHRTRLSAKIAQNSLFAILACPSANRPTFCGEASSGRTPDASNYARVSLSGFQSLLLRAPERGHFDSVGHCEGGKVRRLVAFD